MEQIAKFLFAATALTIFAYVVIFTSSGLAGNGGEYWGYDGLVEPLDAAQQAIDADDYRYLEVNLTDSNGKRIRGVPMYSRCQDHPLGQELVTRQSNDELIHGYDSVNLASDFAKRFNDGINNHLAIELGACCGDCKQIE